MNLLLLLASVVRFCAFHMDKNMKPFKSPIPVSACFGVVYMRAVLYWP